MIPIADDDDADDDDYADDDDEAMSDATVDNNQQSSTTVLVGDTSRYPGRRAGQPQNIGSSDWQRDEEAWGSWHREELPRIVSPATWLSC